MACSIREATGSRKGGRVKHFRPFSFRVSLSGADFFSRERELLVEDLTAHKSKSSGYVNNVTG